MEAIIFVGIQGSGKSTFFKRGFFNTHVRINLDMLKTRHRERLLLAACVEMKQPFVVDNTNPRIEDRARYIAPAKAAGFRIVCYYFRASVGESITRNNLRPDGERVPPAAIGGTAKRLELPSPAEGFDAIHQVRINAQGEFVVEEWPPSDPPV